MFQRKPADLLARRVPGARHLLNLTSPKEFRSAVVAFLK
jgi:hypothetical protein